MAAIAEKGTWGGWNRGKRRPAVRPRQERDALLLENRDVVRWAVTRLILSGRLPRCDEEDALAEGILAGLRAAELWDARSFRVSFRGYLYATVRRALWERFPRLPFALVALSEKDQAPDRPQAPAEELPAWVRALVTERQYRALELRFGRGWTFAEVGRALGAQDHTACLLCQRALARLRKALGVSA